MSALWQISASLADMDAALAVGEALRPFAESVSVFESEAGWAVEAISRGRPDRGPVVAAVAVVSALAGASAPDLAVASLPETDWLARNRDSFPVMRIGRFHIHGSHHRPPPPGSAIGLRIDAAAAFGSGSHASTAGCLRALERLARAARPRRVLDLGCGTAILAMAAACIWPTAAILARDIDPAAVRVAAGNVRANALARRVRVTAGPGYAGAAIRRAGRFDLILANILAGPLRRLAGPAARHLAPGGRIILSGLLERDERAVIAAHRARGLMLEHRCRIEGWSTLTLRARRRACRPAGRDA